MVCEAVPCIPSRRRPRIPETEIDPNVTRHSIENHQPNKIRKRRICYCCNPYYNVWFHSFFYDPVFPSRHEQNQEDHFDIKYKKVPYCYYCHNNNGTTVCEVGRCPRRDHKHQKRSEKRIEIKNLNPRSLNRTLSSVDSDDQHDSYYEYY
jgi:hypothetical protein